MWQIFLFWWFSHLFVTTECFGMIQLKVIKGKIRFSHVSLSEEKKTALYLQLPIYREMLHCKIKYVYSKVFNVFSEDKSFIWKNYGLRILLLERVSYFLSGLMVSVFLDAGRSQLSILVRFRLQQLDSTALVFS